MSFAIYKGTYFKYSLNLWLYYEITSEKQIELWQ